MTNEQKLREALQRIKDDTILDRQDADYYKRIMLVHVSWCEEALSQPTGRVELDDISRAHVVTAEELRQKVADDMRVLAPTSDEGTPIKTRWINALTSALRSHAGALQVKGDECTAALLNQAADTLHAKERELAELRYWAEEYECAMKCLDDAKVPRGEQKGEHFANYSLWGRITEFATLQSVSAAPQEGNADDDRHLSNHPQECPITGEPFFMTIEHPERGMVATYGGPFDSYTIPERDDDGQLIRERYDHDRGGWVEYESIGLYVVDDSTPPAATSGKKEDGS